MTDLTRELARIVGLSDVATSPDLLTGYTTDWTRRFRGPATCVVRPASTSEVAQVLSCCTRLGASVVPQGGNTGLVGGSIPPPGRPGDPAARPCVVMSMRRLNQIGDVDPVARQVTAGAGATIGAVQARARAAGLTYGVDLASRDSATVGGTISTNAGGVHTIRYGSTRAQVQAVEAVRADGSVLNLPHNLAGNTGYDLAGLLAGSEGTLAVITQARLRLWQPDAVGAVVLAGVADIAEAASLQAAVRAKASVRAMEYIELAGVALVCKVAGLPTPLARLYPGYLLMEIIGTAADAERLAKEADLPADAAVALDGPDRARLWAYRERHTEAMSTLGVPHKLDVLIPLDTVAEFRERLNGVVREAAGPDSALIVFGHIGAGNLHVNILGPEPDDERADGAVLRLAAACGGSISAEHGIGRAKARWLELARSEPEIAAMRAVKTAFDPAGTLNPGVLFG